MDRFVRAHAARFAVIAGVLALVAFAAAPAGAATPCGQRVLEDWSDNGRIDRVYELRCYEEAIDSAPSDLRDYTDVTDVIERALTAALRETPGNGGPSGGGSPPVAPPIRTAAASSVPVVPVAGAGLAFLLVLAGGAAYLVRRRAA